MAKHRAPDTPDYSRPTAMKVEVPAEVVDIKKEFLTRDNEIGLGRKAVHASMRETELDIRGLRPNSLSPYKLNLGYLLPGHVEEIRNTVKDLREPEAEYINRMLAGTYMRNALFKYEDEPSNTDLTQNSLGKRLAEKVKVIDEVTKKEIEKYAVSDETVVNFAEWYMGQTLERQAELDEQIGSLRRQFKERVQHAIAEWGLSIRASQQLRHIDAVDVLEDDMFVMRKNKDAAGLYWYPTKDKQKAKIMLSPLELKTGQRQHTITHELTHSLSDDPEATYSRGTMLVQVFGSMGGEVMNEALTDHLAGSLLHGDFDVINPRSRKEEGAYEEYRQFLDMLANSGQVKIDIREFYDALYFTQQDDIRQFVYGEKVQLLLEKIERAYPGMDMIARMVELQNLNDLQMLINSMYDNIDSHVDNQSQDKKLVSAALAWGDEFDDN